MRKIIQGNCIEKLKELEDNSVDSIVTDPPYGLGFMGKEWDTYDPTVNKGSFKVGTGTHPQGYIAIDKPAFQEFNYKWAKECLRVLKPGGHLLAFSGTRTYHRMACAIEDAGFEVRDMMCWAYGQGFPKSLNISLQIKKKYNIGLCTCNIFEPMIQLGYENSNNKRDNISNGDNDGLGSGKQIQDKGTNNNEVAKQVKDTDISPDNTLGKESELCELSETNIKKKQGLKKVSKSVLQSGVCKSISEDKGHGHATLRAGLETTQTTSEREGQGLSDMQNETTDGIAGSSFNTIQNGRQELNGELGWSLSELPQQDRENNRKRVEQIKNDCGIEEWNNLSRFICSKCYLLKKDIGGTALKPSIEPICMARKPLAEKTVAENCLKYGTGGINIDESRVGAEERTYSINGATKGGNFGNGANQPADEREQTTVIGRFPANLIHDNSEEVRECFPETKTGSIKPYKTTTNSQIYGGGKGYFKDGDIITSEHTGDSGNASRFFKSIKKPYIYKGKEYEVDGFVKSCKPQAPSNYNDEGSPARYFKSIIYQAKASKSERNNGMDGLEAKPMYKADGSAQSLEIFGSTDGGREDRKNNHPTVKPITLMQYLIKMITPKGGVVLDPFMGSGSTGVACIQNNFNFIGIEMEKEYIAIAEARISNAEKELKSKLF